MSTHNIGFYEEISKIIPELTSNIIKYAPYLFFWSSSSWLLKELTVSVCLISIGKLFQNNYMKAQGVPQ